MSIDLTPAFDEELKRRNAPPTRKPSLTLQNIDEFLKEAYRINTHLVSLTTYLRDIRQSYLSTAQAPRRTAKNDIKDKTKYLTDRQRDEIDAETKQLLRELNTSIRNLADAEQLRQNTELVKSRRKYGSRFGALSSWAAGDSGSAKSAEEEEDDARNNTSNMHRESVLWYLRQKLQVCGSLQASMMEVRITRAMEKNKSVLSKASVQPLPDFGAYEHVAKPKMSASKTAQMDEQRAQRSEEQLSPEQLQMFEKENQDMLKHYEATLDQVRTAEKSLVEISELQSQLVNNLATQSAHIDQLVADSINTTENVGGGNQQLKRAAERKSTAKYVFYASCGLSLTLVVWDLLI